MRRIVPGNPLEYMDHYLYLTDWSLLQEVSRWGRRGTPLGREWDRILNRDLKWKLAYERTLSLRELHSGVDSIGIEDWESRIRDALPSTHQYLTFQVDIATQDPRPENPLAMGKKQIHTYDPSTDTITKESLAELFEFIPSKIVKFRVFALDHSNDALLARRTEEVFRAVRR